MTKDTSTGLNFEKQAQIICNNGIDISKYALYKWLKSKEVNWQDYISKKLLPDAAFYIEETNQIMIFEKKFQQRAGSVDEKLQTCGFKIYEYRKLFSSLGITNVTYTYILNDWFKQPSYRDVLHFIKTTDGCDYIFFEGDPIYASK